MVLMSLQVPSFCVITVSLCTHITVTMFQVIITNVLHSWMVVYANFVSMQSSVKGHLRSEFAIGV